MSTAAPETELRAGAEFPVGLEYTAYAAFSAPAGLTVPPEHRRERLAEPAATALAGVDGVAVRGVYDVSGYRADVDLLLWIAGPSPDALQETLAAFRATDLGVELTPFWSAIAVHREAEFSKSHVPAFFAGEPARRYVCVYPFVRTTEWYLLEPELRRELLIEHGGMARDYADVRANTTSAFGLGDYEWLLAFEADELVRIVDLIRHLRGARARAYTKNELPFITGVRRPLAEVIEKLPRPRGGYRG